MMANFIEQKYSNEDEMVTEFSKDDIIHDIMLVGLQKIAQSNSYEKAVKIAVKRLKKVRKIRTKGEMKIEDCEVGMKVKCKINSYSLISKNKIYTISEINTRTKKIALKEPCTTVCTFNPLHFEHVNKYEIGDEVVWHNDKVKVWGKRYDNEMNEYEYAIADNKPNCGRTIVFENELSPLKKPDELEKGDKFRQKGKAEHEVVGVHYDEERKSKIYVVRLLDGEIKGAIDLVFPKTIREIIYD